MYPRTAVSSERLKEIMDMPISIDPNEDGVQETETHGYLEFDNVTFAYPGETESPVLHNISFTAKPGETDKAYNFVPADSAKTAWAD